MTTVTSLSDRRRPAPATPTVPLAEQVRRADEAIDRTARNPNEILPRLLAAGCRVTFTADDDGTEVTVTMPGETVVKGTAPSSIPPAYGPMYALVDAYKEGAWLADLPAVLAIAAEG